MNDKIYLNEEMIESTLGYLAKTDGHTKGSSDINELSEIGRYDLKKKRTG